LPVGEIPTTTVWRLIKEANGSLEKIVVEHVDLAVPEVEWERAVQSLINNAFSAALAEKKQRFFKRGEFFYIGQRLDGEYWLPGFRLAPGDPDGSDRSHIFDERVVHIDINVEAIDAHYAGIMAEEIIRRHVARLSLLLNIGFYRPQMGRVWVLPEFQAASSEPEVSERRWLGYYDTEAVDRMPTKGESCKLGEYSGSFFARYTTGATITIPRETRAILRGIAQTDSQVREAFDRGARLYQVSLVIGRQFPSVGLAYRVAAVEAIAKSLPKALDFSEFIRAYVQSDQQVEALIKTLYGSIRSAHFHGGQFPLGEFAATRWFDPLMDEAVFRQQELGMEGARLLRVAILRWVATATQTELTMPEGPILG
jgi:hypothetical protein